MIDWVSRESHILLNPRMPADDRRALEGFVRRDMEAHLWLATSGTTGSLKLTALSKPAMLASAAAVNRHLEARADDVWCCVLPSWHVGGLGIHARAFLSRARVISSEWDPHHFAGLQETTLASLVPAQVTDLVREGLAPPARLRAIVVGGGAVSEELYASARRLGWPILPSYGMTECCSQVATATLEGPELLLLDHVSARVEADGTLALQSDALLSGYATADGFVDPKVDGWFGTGDLATLQGRTLRVAGRKGEFVKIGGESVDLSRLDRILAELGGDAVVVALPDDRLGHVIGLAVASGSPDELAQRFDARVHPFERARRVVRVEEIPRTELGKVIRARLVEKFGTGEWRPRSGEL